MAGVWRRMRRRSAWRQLTDSSGAPEEITRAYAILTGLATALEQARAENDDMRAVVATQVDDLTRQCHETADQLVEKHGEPGLSFPNEYAASFAKIIKAGAVRRR